MRKPSHEETLAPKLTGSSDRAAAGEKAVAVAAGLQLSYCDQGQERLGET
jgi:hypothetical protein